MQNTLSRFEKNRFFDTKTSRNLKLGHTNETYDSNILGIISPDFMVSSELAFY